MALPLVSVKHKTDRAAIRRVQALLAASGYAPVNTFKRDGTPDGVMGGGTDNAIKRFQRSRGLVSDGIVGRNTWTALLGE